MTKQKFFSIKDPLERKRLLENYSADAKRNIRFNARKKAKESIDWLLFYVENVPNVTENPEEELSRVFNQETLLKWGKIGDAMKKGLFYTNSRMLTEGQIVKLQANLYNAHIKFEPLRLFRDKTYRYRKIQKLNERSPGKQEAIMQRLLAGEPVNDNEVERTFRR